MPGARVAVALAAAVAFVLHAMHAWNAWTDDAYISFRYARNLVAGHGLVFNPGERVEGLTNLGWALLLAPFTGGDVLLVAKLAGLALSLGVIALLTAWARAEDVGAAGLAVALVPWVLLPWAPFWSVSGMETAAVAFVVTLAWTRYRVEADRGRGWATAAATGLAPFLRPDAAVLAPVLGLWHLRRGRPDAHSARSAVLVLALAAVLVALKLAWFDAVLPNTFAAKRQAFPWPGGQAYLGHFLRDPSPWLPGAAACALAWGLLGAAKGHPRGLPALVVLAWVGIAWATGGDWFANYRFLVPALPAIGAVLAHAVDAAATRARLAEAGGLLGAAVCAALALPSTGVLTVDRLNHAQLVRVEKRAPLFAPWRDPRWDRGWTEQWAFPAAWALAHAPRDAAVAFTDIGLFSWVNDHRVIDLLGLTEPALVQPPGADPRAWWTGARAWLTGHADFAIVERGSDRHTAVAGDAWVPVDGCGAVGVYARAARWRRPEADELSARVDAMFARAPRHPALHVAVVRELLAARAPEPLVAETLARASATAPPAFRHDFVSLRCTTGVTAGCTPVRDACGGFRPVARGSAKDL